METPTNAIPVPDALRGVEARLGDLDRKSLRDALAPLIDQLRSPLSGPQAGEAANAALGICRQLYANARSADALVLSRAVLDQASFSSDQELVRRASTAHGLLLADTGDVVMAINHHVEALRIARAHDDSVEEGRTWNNIGLALGVAGNFGMAARCYARSLEAVEALPGPLYSRYAACGNLANCFYQLGQVETGLDYGLRALRELTPGFRAIDPTSVVVVERNVIRLFIALDRLPEAALHVQAIAVQSPAAPTPRAAVAVATARADYELATGQVDVAMTRLERALAGARATPAVLRDTLAYAVRAEEAAGNPGRALMRLRELCEHDYRIAVERAHCQLELAVLTDAGSDGMALQQEQARARITSRLRPVQEPAQWKALQRLAVGAALRFDGTGEHGIRVGALSKALALATGSPPLEALEIGLAAELHDIGMSSVPEAILAKRSPLNEAEQRLYLRHTDAGAEILRDDRHPRVLMAAEIARYHHAAWDGSGHPERVGGRFIPKPARVCAIADAYDSLVCGEASGTALTMDAALAAVRARAGTSFDPELVEGFDGMIRAESSDLGDDSASHSGMHAFRELIASLQEDRGFA